MGSSPPVARKTGKDKSLPIAQVNKSPTCRTTEDYYDVRDIMMRNSGSGSQELTIDKRQYKFCKFKIYLDMQKGIENPILEDIIRSAYHNDPSLYEGVNFTDQDHKSIDSLFKNLKDEILKRYERKKPDYQFHDLEFMQLDKKGYDIKSSKQEGIIRYLMDCFQNNKLTYLIGLNGIGKTMVCMETFKELITSHERRESKKIIYIELNANDLTKLDKHMTHIGSTVLFELEEWIGEYLKIVYPHIGKITNKLSYYLYQIRNEIVYVFDNFSVLANKYGNNDFKKYYNSILRLIKANEVDNSSNVVLVLKEENYTLGQFEDFAKKIHIKGFPEKFVTNYVYRESEGHIESLSGSFLELIKTPFYFNLWEKIKKAHDQNIERSKNEDLLNFQHLALDHFSLIKKGIRHLMRDEMVKFDSSSDSSEVDKVVNKIMKEIAEISVENYTHENEKKKKLFVGKHASKNSEILKKLGIAIDDKNFSHDIYEFYFITICLVEKPQKEIHLFLKNKGLLNEEKILLLIFITRELVDRSEIHDFSNENNKYVDKLNEFLQFLLAEGSDNLGIRIFYSLINIVLKHNEELLQSITRKRINEHLYRRLQVFEMSSNFIKFFEDLSERPSLINFMKNIDGGGWLFNRFVKMLKKHSEKVRYLNNGQVFINIYDAIIGTKKGADDNSDPNLIINYISAHLYSGKFQEAITLWKDNEAWINKHFKILGDNDNHEDNKNRFRRDLIQSTIYRIDNRNAVKRLKNAIDFTVDMRSVVYGNRGIALYNLAAEKLSHLGVILAKETKDNQIKHINSIINDAYESLHWIDFKKYNISALKCVLVLMEGLSILQLLNSNPPQEIFYRNIIEICIKPVLALVLDFENDFKEYVPPESLKKHYSDYAYDNLLLCLMLGWLKMKIAYKVDGSSREETLKIISSLGKANNRAPLNLTKTYSDKLENFNEIILSLSNDDNKEAMRNLAEFSCDNFIFSVNEDSLDDADELLSLISFKDLEKNIFDYYKEWKSDSESFDVYKINMRCNKGLTLLHYACAIGDIESIDDLIKKGAYVSTRSKNGFSPFHLACQYNQVDVIRHLLSHFKYLIMAFDNDGYTPLHLCSYMGFTNLAGLILQSANKFPYTELLHATDKHGYTAEQYANDCGHKDIVKSLIAKGISIKAVTGKKDYKNKYLRPRMYQEPSDEEKNAAKSLKDQIDNLVDILDEESPLGPMIGNFSDGKIFHFLAMQLDPKYFKLVSYLMEKIENLEEYVKPEWWSPIHKAALRGNYHFIKCVIKQLVDISTFNSDSWSFMHEAATCADEIRTIEIFAIVHGSNLNLGKLLQMQDENGMTPLHYLVIMQRKKVLDYLFSLNLAQDKNILQITSDYLGLTPAALSAIDPKKEYCLDHKQIMKIYIENYKAFPEASKDEEQKLFIISENDRNLFAIKFVTNKRLINIEYIDINKGVEYQLFYKFEFDKKWIDEPILSLKCYFEKNENRHDKLVGKLTICILYSSFRIGLLVIDNSNNGKDFYISNVFYNLHSFCFMKSNGKVFLLVGGTNGLIQFYSFDRNSPIQTKSVIQVHYRNEIEIELGEVGREFLWIPVESVLNSTNINLHEQCRYDNFSSVIKKFSLYNIRPCQGQNILGNNARIYFCAARFNTIYVFSLLCDKNQRSFKMEYKSESINYLGAYQLFVIAESENVKNKYLAFSVINKLKIINLDTLREEIVLQDVKDQNVISKLSISLCGQYILVKKSNNRILIYTKQNNMWINKQVFELEYHFATHSFTYLHNVNKLLYSNAKYLLSQSSENSDSSGEEISPAGRSFMVCKVNDSIKSKFDFFDNFFSTFSTRVMDEYRDNKMIFKEIAKYPLFSNYQEVKSYCLSLICKENKLSTSSSELLFSHMKAGKIFIIVFGYSNDAVEKLTNYYSDRKPNAPIYFNQLMKFAIDFYDLFDSEILYRADTFVPLIHNLRFNGNAFNEYRKEMYITQNNNPLTHAKHGLSSFYNIAVGWFVVKEKDDKKPEYFNLECVGISIRPDGGLDIDIDILQEAILLRNDKQFLPEIVAYLENNHELKGKHLALFQGYCYYNLQDYTTCIEKYILCFNDAEGLVLNNREKLRKEISKIIDNNNNFEENTLTSKIYFKSNKVSEFILEQIVSCSVAYFYDGKENIAFEILLTLLYKIALPIFDNRNSKMKLKEKDFSKPSFKGSSDEMENFEQYSVLLLRSSYFLCYFFKIYSLHYLSKNIAINTLSYFDKSRSDLEKSTGESLLDSSESRLIFYETLLKNLLIANDFDNIAKISEEDFLQDAKKSAAFFHTNPLEFSEILTNIGLYYYSKSDERDNALRFLSHAANLINDIEIPSPEMINVLNYIVLIQFLEHNFYYAHRYIQEAKTLLKSISPDLTITNLKYQNAIFIHTFAHEVLLNINDHFFNHDKWMQKDILCPIILFSREPDEEEISAVKQGELIYIHKNTTNFIVYFYSSDSHGKEELLLKKHECCNLITNLEALQPDGEISGGEIKDIKLKTMLFDFVKNRKNGTAQYGLSVNIKLLLLAIEEKLRSFKEIKQFIALINNDKMKRWRDEVILKLPKFIEENNDILRDNLTDQSFNAVFYKRCLMFLYIYNILLQKATFDLESSEDSIHKTRFYTKLNQSVMSLAVRVIDYIQDTDFLKNGEYQNFRDHADKSEKLQTPKEVRNRPTTENSTKKFVNRRVKSVGPTMHDFYKISEAPSVTRQRSRTGDENQSQTSSAPSVGSSSGQPGPSSSRNT